MMDEVRSVPSPMDEKQQRAMLALERRAIKSGWPISDNMKKELVDSAHEIATSPGTPQNRLSAMRNLLAMEGQNIERERIDAQVSGPDRDEGVVRVVYADDWFYQPTEEQVRELENHRGGSDERDAKATPED